MAARQWAGQPSWATGQAPWQLSAWHHHARMVAVLALVVMLGFVPRGSGIGARSTTAAIVPPSAAQLAALEAIPGVAVRWNESLGTPSTLVRYGSTLTADPTSAPGFLAGHAAIFGLPDSSMLIPAREYRSARGEASHVEFEQTAGGLPILGASVKVTLDPEGRVVAAGGTVYRDLIASGSLDLAATDALALAAARLGLEVLAAPALLDSGSGAVTLTNPFMGPEAAPVVARPVVYPLDRFEGRVAWSLWIDTPLGWHQLVIDGAHGATLQELRPASNAPEALVFVGENPDESTRTQVPLVGAAFNDAGWVTDRATSGNNANVYTDTNNDNNSDYQTVTPPSGDPDYQQFVFPFADAYVTSGGSDITTDRDATLTQAFYRVNWLHDYFYELGFDEASGNFQTDNFGRGGSGGDAMLVEVHNGALGGPQGPSNTQSPPDGGAPRMELRVGLVDEALDGDLVAHEFTHGVTNRLLANGPIPQGEQSWALGEGWSDYFASSIWDDPIAGEYVCGNANGCPQYPYDASPLVYSDLCTRAATANQCEPHADGEIWTAALWDLRTAMIAAYGQNAGVATTDQLVLDGVKATTPARASFLDARDGILSADVATNGGAHQCLIWRIFAGREMGLSAATGADQTVATPATDVPAGCLPSADAGAPYSTTEGVDVLLSAAASSPGADPSVGSLTFQWDLDDDGEHDDATGQTASFTMVGQDGTFDVGLRVTNGAGLSADATTSVSVSNVAPAVSLTPVAPILEGGTITLAGLATDPGWLDALTLTIDWGDGAGPSAASPTIENDRPDATATWSETHQYGDNGAFTVQACVADDDSQTCRSVTATVNNVAPTVSVDGSGQVDYAGTKAFVHQVGTSIEVPARFEDPGSDDLTLTWDWDDGTTSSETSLVNPPLTDPPLSPSVQPRALDRSMSHTFLDACLWQVEVSALDDDSGSASAGVAVITVGDGTRAWSAGWWMRQYRPAGPPEFSDETLACYLDIVTFFSTVFVSPMTFDDAMTTLSPDHNLGEEIDLLDRQLLAVWLNVANGALSLDDDVGGVPLADLLLAAETVRLDPAATEADRLEARLSLTLAIANP